MPLVYQDGFGTLLRFARIESPLQEIPFFSNVHRASRLHLDHDTLRLMNVTAKEVLRLVFLDKLAYGAAAAVETVVDAIKFSIVGRRVANKNKRLEICEFRQTFA